MKNRDLRKLALLGLTSGIVLTQSLGANDNSKIQISSLLAANTSKTDDSKSKIEPDANDSNLGYHLMSEDELLLELNADGQRLYKSLDPAGKELARKAASVRCNGSNECKGLNACKTDKNDCAGKGSCQGQGKCSFSDKNLAVKLVYEKMANKRAAANSGQ